MDSDSHRIAIAANRLTLNGGSISEPDQERERIEENAKAHRNAHSSCIYCGNSSASLDDDLKPGSSCRAERTGSQSLHYR